jgi:hypothetical protein
MWTAGRDPVLYRDMQFKVPESMQSPPWRINPETGKTELDKSKGTTAVHVWRAMIAAAPKLTPSDECDRKHSVIARLITLKAVLATIGDKIMSPIDKLSDKLIEQIEGVIVILGGEKRPAAPGQWVTISPDGKQFWGDTPLKACSQAQKHRIATDPQAAKTFVEAIEKLKREAEEENAKLEAEHGSLNCPACGGSGHVGDFVDIKERRESDTNFLLWLDIAAAWGDVAFGHDSDGLVWGRFTTSDGLRKTISASGRDLREVLTKLRDLSGRR